MKTAFCFDLDGTVTQQEILPLISQEVDLHEEISLLTQLTLDGLIPFQNSFKLRVKLLSSIPISRVSAIVDSTILEPAIVDFIHKYKEDCYIVTGNLDVWIQSLVSNKIKCKFYSSLAERDGDQLLGVKSVIEKADVIKTLSKQYDRIVAIGDSMNDCSMFEKADVGVAYGGTHNPVDSLISLANYVTYSPRSLVEILENQRTL